MNVLLLAPPYPLEEFPSPPLGLCYVAAAFESAGCNVRIMDFIVQKYTPEKLVKEMDDFSPDIVGTNSVTMNHITAVEILKTAKQHDTGIVTMMGGPHISFDFADTLSNCPEIDVAVIGEGEQTIQEIIPLIRQKEKWLSVNGIAFMDHQKLVKTPKRAFISDLDALPHLPRHLLPLSKYLALGLPASIITSRGCPNRCIFCVGNKMVGHRFRTRSISNILDEIRDLVDMGFEQINFADDFFTVNKKRVKAICEEIKERGLTFGWSVFARADSVDRDMMKTMKDAGCHTVLFGIESGNQEMLDRINKRITIEQIKKAVAMCKDVGMQVFGSFIVGLPGENMDTLMDSHRLAMEMDVLYGYHFLSPFPGTRLMEQLDSYDLNVLTRDWSLYDANHPIVSTSALSPEDITGFVVRYYNEQNRENDAALKKRFENGQCTDAELLVIRGNQKMKVVYALLTNDIIETLPAFSAADAKINHLSNVVSCRIQQAQDIVHAALHFLVDRAYLECRAENNEYRWVWA